MQCVRSDVVGHRQSLASTGRVRPCFLIIFCAAYDQALAERGLRVQAGFWAFYNHVEVMTETKTTTTMPVMELRETLRRFGWLAGMLAVISAVTVLAHEPMSRLIEQRQEAVRLAPTAATMLALR